MACVVAQRFVSRKVHVLQCFFFCDYLLTFASICLTIFCTSWQYVVHVDLKNHATVFSLGWTFPTNLAQNRIINKQITMETAFLWGGTDNVQRMVNQTQTRNRGLCDSTRCLENLWELSIKPQKRMLSLQWQDTLDEAASLAKVTEILGNRLNYKKAWSHRWQVMQSFVPTCLEKRWCARPVINTLLQD